MTCPSENHEAVLSALYGELNDTKGGETMDKIIISLGYIHPETRILHCYDKVWRWTVTSATDEEVYVEFYTDL